MHGQRQGGQQRQAMNIQYVARSPKQFQKAPPRKVGPQRERAPKAPPPPRVDRNPATVTAAPAEETDPFWSLLTLVQVIPLIHQEMAAEAHHGAHSPGPKHEKSGSSEEEGNANSAPLSSLATTDATTDETSTSDEVISNTNNKSTTDFTLDAPHLPCTNLSRSEEEEEQDSIESGTVVVLDL